MSHANIAKIMARYTALIHYGACMLSLRVLLVSLAAIIVFGPVLKKLLSINLILLLGILQVLYLGVLVYLDGYFDSRYKEKDWLRIQNN